MRGVFLSIFLLITYPVYPWTLGYSNTDGNTTGWTESYDSASKFALSQSTVYHRIDASSSSSEVWGGYRLDTAGPWSDCIFRLEIYDMASNPRSMKDHIGLRVQDTGSFPTNGYYFYCTGCANPYQSGYWQATGCTWGSNTNYAAATVYDRYDFRITGSGWNTVVTVFSSSGATMSAFTNPSITLASGKVVHGYSTTNFYTGYTLRKNFYVYDLTETSDTNQSPRVSPWLKYLRGF